MEEEDSHYLHASLYAFTDVGRNNLISRFRNKIQDDRVQLSYSTTTDTFFLRCPSGKGALADSTLSQLIEDYIGVERDAAAKEDREPHVLRFPESTFDGLGEFEDRDAGILARPMELQPSSQVSRTQIVMTPGNEGQLVKLFYLHDLQSHGLLERTLAARNDRIQRLMNSGLVCRAARWSNEDGHVFNGRVGSHNTGSQPARADGLHLPPFTVLHDRRRGVVPLGGESKKLEWSFVPGQEATSVKQWLQGIGETQQTTPEARADIPKDAKQHLAAAQTHTAGRARIPKGTSYMPADAMAEDKSSDSDSECGDFASILRPDGSNPTLQITQSNVAGETSSRNAPGPQNSSRDLLPGGGDDRALVTTKGRDTSVHQVSPRTATESLSVMRDNPKHQKPTGPVQQSADEWRDMADSAHTKVDTMGLTANASTTAQWQNEKRLRLNCKRTKPRNSRLVPRAAGKSKMPSADSCSGRSPLSGLGCQESQQRPLSSKSDEKNSVLYTQGTRGQIIGEDATWSNKVDASRGPVASQLVDVASHQSSGAVQVPPGFSVDRGPQNRAAQAPTASPDLDRAENLVKLIDLTDDETSTKRTKVTAKLSTNTLPIPRPPVSSQRQNHDGRIDERIRPLSESYAKRYNTMRQKSGYNVKGKKGKGKTTGHNYKVELELPEPLPIPKKKERQQHHEGSGIVVQQPGARSGVPKTPGEVSEAPNFMPSTMITRDGHAFGELLRSEILKQKVREEEDEQLPVGLAPKLVARLGLLLVRPADKEQELSFNAHKPLEMQSNLRDVSLRTDFLPRLTTSSVDAASILDVALQTGGPTTPRTPNLVLEFIIRDSVAGQLLKMVVPVGQGGKDRAQYTVKTRERNLGDASCHYAVHVWDAQISLVQPGTHHELSSMSAISDFIASMNSDGDPPSFRAQVSVGVFTVERVLAKRIFKTEKDGMVFKLSEVQDLIQEPLDLRDYNLQVMTRSREEMIEEQRYWWEARWESTDLSRADELQACVDGMVKQMDDVGLENQGPFIVSDLYRSEDETEMPERPFW